MPEMFFGRKFSVPKKVAVTEMGLNGIEGLHYSFNTLVQLI
jgi:hypothetical protein